MACVLAQWAHSTETWGEEVVMLQKVIRSARELNLFEVFEAFIHDLRANSSTDLRVEPTPNLAIAAKNFFCVTKRVPLHEGTVQQRTARPKLRPPSCTSFFCF
jgi:hypothetical protein